MSGWSLATTGRKRLLSSMLGASLIVVGVAGLMIGFGPVNAPAEAAPSSVTVTAPDGIGRVTVEQTENLVSQRVRVSWTGFVPSSAPAVTPETSFPVKVWQCRGINPRFDADLGVADCYGSETYQYPGRDPANPFPDGPPNAVETITAEDGTGGVDIEIYTKRESATMGCDQQHPCTIVVEPNYGVNGRGTDPIDYDFLICGCDTSTNAFFDRPWAMDQRVVIPIRYAPTGEVCSLTNEGADITVGGSPVFRRAAEQWQPFTCNASSAGATKAVDFDYTQLAEPQARANFLGSSRDVALTTLPASAAETASASRTKFVYAPVAISGVSVGIWIDDPVTGQPITEVNLNPRLVAKLLTQSYGTRGADCRETDPTKVCNHAVDGNPADFFQDPEFLALNPQQVNWPFIMEFPLVPAGRLDLVTELTRWISADAEARDFLRGQPDPWGMEVNTHYRGVSYPAEQFEARDPFDVPLVPPNYVGTDWSFVHGYIPISGLENVVRSLTVSRPIREYYVPNPGSWVRAPAQIPGQRALIGIVDAASAENLRIPTAKLRNGAGAFVAPTSASMTVAADAMTLDEATGTRKANYTSNVPGVYPLTTVTYAMAPTSGLSQSKANKVANFIEHAAGRGQLYGTAPGDLPAGFASLTDTLKTQTDAAVLAVRNQTGGTTLPTPTPSTTPGANGNPITSTTGPAGAGGGATGSPLPGGPPTGANNGDYQVSGSTESVGWLRWILPALVIGGGIALLAGPVMVGVAGTGFPRMAMQRLTALRERWWRRRPVE